MDYLTQLDTNGQFNELVASNIPIETIVHFSRPNVIASVAYKRLIELLKPKRNLVLNESNRHSGLISAYRRQTELNSFDERIFRKLR